MNAYFADVHFVCVRVHLKAHGLTHAYNLHLQGDGLYTSYATDFRGDTVCPNPPGPKTVVIQPQGVGWSDWSEAGHADTR